MDTFVLTGSDLNQRTFAEDESWNSLQSTILAGNVVDNSEISVSEATKLSTVEEECSWVFEDSGSDNKLNINLDALSDDDVFFDAVASPSPKKRSPSYRLLLSPNRRAEQSNFLSVNAAMTLQGNCTTLGSEHNTGEMLAQAFEDFNDIVGHAQSTPKSSYEIDETSGSFGARSSHLTSAKDSSTSDLMCKRNLDAYFNAETAALVAGDGSSKVNQSNKENYFDGKYSAAVKREQPSLEKSLSKSSAQKQGSTAKPPPKIPGLNKHRRVARMKEFFERQARLNDQPVVRTSVEPKIGKRSSERPSYIPVLKCDLSRRTTLHPAMSPQKKSAKSMVQLMKSPQLKKSSKSPLRPKKSHQSAIKSPTYRTRATHKLARASSSKFSPRKSIGFNGSDGDDSGVRSYNSSSRGYNSSAGDSFLVRNQLKVSDSQLRPASCSEFPTDSSLDSCSSRSRSTRSKSLSDAVSDESNTADFKCAIKMNRVAVRSYMQGANGRRKITPKKVSAIMKRKSLSFLSTPVKPVTEIRKIYSPSANPMTKSKKSSGKTKIVPRIVIEK